MANSLYIKFDNIGRPLAYRTSNELFLSQFWDYSDGRYYKMPYSLAELDIFAENEILGFQNIVNNYVLIKDLQEEVYEESFINAFDVMETREVTKILDLSTIQQLSDTDSSARIEAIQKQKAIESIAKERLAQLEIAYKNAQIVMLEDSKTFEFPIQGETYKDFKTKVNDGNNLGSSKITYRGIDNKFYSVVWTYIMINELFAIVDPISNRNYDIKIKYFSDIQTAIATLDLTALQDMTFTFEPKQTLDLDAIIDSIANDVNSNPNMALRYQDRPTVISNFITWYDNLTQDANGKYELFTPII